MDQNQKQQQQVQLQQQMQQSYEAVTKCLQSTSIPELEWITSETIPQIEAVKAQRQFSQALTNLHVALVKIEKGYSQVERTFQKNDKKFSKQGIVEGSTNNTRSSSYKNRARSSAGRFAPAGTQ